MGRYYKHIFDSSVLPLLTLSAINTNSELSLMILVRKILDRTRYKLYSSLVSYIADQQLISRALIMCVCLHHVASSNLRMGYASLDMIMLSHDYDRMPWWEIAALLAPQGIEYLCVYFGRRNFLPYLLTADTSH